MAFSPRKLARTVSVAASACALMTLAQPAMADEPVKGNYVSFGDSIPSNPSILDVGMYNYISKHPDQKIEWPTIKNGRCAHSPGNVGDRVAENTGLHLEDYSCAGAPAYTKVEGYKEQAFFPGQVDAALRDGNLNADTRLVSIIIGVNDTYQQVNLKRTQEERIKLYVDSVSAQIDRIRKAAPNAKIVLAGYPDETDGQNRTCATSLLGTTSHWYFPFVAYFQDEIRQQQRQVAERTGVTFLDMAQEINVAKGNSGCLQHGDRLNAALFDDGATHKLGGHLTENGSKYYGRRIAEQL